MLNLRLTVYKDRLKAETAPDLRAINGMGMFIAERGT